MTTAQIDVLDPAQLAAASDALAAVYGAAFAQPPYNEPEEAAVYFAQILRRNAASPPAGFRCCVARAASGAFVGFGYGFTYGPGTSRYDLLAQVLAPESPEVAARWLDDAFDLIELAVHPGVQGRGIGARLHDALLEGQPHRTAVLTAYDGETVAMRLYRSRGWAPISGQMFFPGGTEPHLVLGLDLARWRAQSGR